MPHLVKGTLILASATLLCRILGLIYYFPFLWLVGLSGAALYGYAYNPYTVFLSLSTLGLPLAVSKMVAKYHALGDFDTIRRLFHSGLWVMLALGSLGCGMLIIWAPMAARAFIGHETASHTGGNELADVILVIRVVSLALIIVPVMSLIRGYFQGLQQMMPTAVSQVIEQLARIGFILLGALLVVKVWQGTVVMAVVFAVAAAFVGALAGLAVLGWFWRQPGVHHLTRPATTTHFVQPLGKLYLELLRYAIPFVFIGLAIPLYLLIDSITLNTALIAYHGLSLAEAERIFSVVNQTTHKIIMIPVSLATALGLTLIPTMTRLFTDQDQHALQKAVNQTMQLLLFLTLPAVVGLAILAEPAYGVLYALQDWELGGHYLSYYAPVALLFALFTVTAAILQGINQQKIAVSGLLLGISFKIFMNTYFIRLWGGEGALLATASGYGLAIIFHCIWIQRTIGMTMRQVWAGCGQIAGLSALMAVLLWGIRYALTPFYLQMMQHYGYALLFLSLNLIFGAVLYLGLAFQTQIAQSVLGARWRYWKKN